MTYEYEFKRVEESLSEKLKVYKQVLDQLEATVTSLFELVETASRYNVKLDEGTKKGVIARLEKIEREFKERGFEDPDTILRELREVYKAITRGIFASIAPWVVEIVLACGDDLLRYRSGVIAAVKIFVENLRDVADHYSHFSRVATSLREFRESPCAIFENPSILSSIHSAWQVTKYLTKELSEILLCEEKNTERVVENYLVDVEDLTNLERRIEKLKSLLELLREQKSRIGDHNSVIKALEAVRDSLNEMKQGSIIVASMASSLENETNNALSTLLSQRDVVCTAQQLESVERALELYRKTVEELLRTACDKIKRYKDIVTAVSTRLKTSIHGYEELHEPISLDGLSKALKSVKNVDSVINKILSSALSTDEKSVFEKLLKLMYEKGVRHLRVERTMRNHLSETEIYQIFELCSMGILECTIRV